MAKARKIPHLNPDENLKTCLSKILHARFNEMISHEKGTLEPPEGGDIEELHNMRVASRRVQAVMKVFREAFPKAAFQKQYKVIRGLKDVLGEVRHFDVFIYALEKYRTSPPTPLRRREEKTTPMDSGLELLIIRQKALRGRKRREMMNYIRGLNKKNYKERFLEFAKKF
jgi:CHAD domain-containing protein